MATIEELVIKIQADNDQLKAEMKAASQTVASATSLMSKAMSDVAKNTEKSSSTMRKVMESFAGNLLAKVVVGAFGAVKNAASATFQTFVVDGIKASMATEDAMNQLMGALSRTGQVTDGTRKRMQEFAGQLQNTTKFGDDAILNAASLLQNLARLDEQGLKRATAGATDLAAAMGVDLNTASTMIGKAINGNGTALRKLGIDFEDTGSKSKNLTIIMDQLNQRFGGAAAAQLKTFGGASALLGNAFSDLTKVFGGAIVQNPAIISAFNDMSKFLNQVTEATSEATPALRILVADALKPVASAFNLAAQGALFLVSQLDGLATAKAVMELDRLNSKLEQTDKVYNDLQAEIESGNAKEFQINWFKELSANRAELQKEIEAQDKVVAARSKSSDSIQDMLSKISAASSTLNDSIQSYDSQKAAIAATGDAAKTTADQIEDATSKISPALEQARKFAEELAKAQTGGGSDQNLLQAKLDADLISQQEFDVASRQLMMDRHAAEAEMLQLALDNEKQLTEDHLLAIEELDKRHQAEIIKNDDKTKKKKEEMRMAELSATAQLFGGISDLSRAFGKENNAMAKASGIAQATINTYVGATKALAQGGIVGPILAAAVIASGIAQVAKIAATPLQTGIDSVPGVGNQDNFPAMLAPGERVVPRETNKDLTSFLQKGESEPKTVMNVSVSISDVFTSDPREVGQKLIEHINEAAQANGVQMLSSRIR